MLQLIKFILRPPLVQRRIVFLLHVVGRQRYVLEEVFVVAGRKHIKLQSQLSLRLPSAQDSQEVPDTTTKDRMDIPRRRVLLRAAFPLVPGQLKLQDDMPNNLPPFWRSDFFEILETRRPQPHLAEIGPLENILPFSTYGREGCPSAVFLLHDSPQDHEPDLDREIDPFPGPLGCQSSSNHFVFRFLLSLKKEFRKKEAIGSHWELGV